MLKCHIKLGHTLPVLTTAADMSANDTDPSSSYVEFNGWNVWFDVYGSGPKAVLLIPGGIGTGRTDFYEQLEGNEPLDFDELTLVAVDPPGNGRSRPPVRKYGKDCYETDAQCYQKIMQVNIL